MLCFGTFLLVAPLVLIAWLFVHYGKAETKEEKKSKEQNLKYLKLVLIVPLALAFWSCFLLPIILITFLYDDGAKSYFEPEQVAAGFDEVIPHPPG